MADTITHFSRSEDAGIQYLPKGLKRIYSVGISTGGIAEMRMSRELPSASIIATTVDEKGVAFARGLIQKEGLADSIEVKLEDVARPLSYADNFFDYVYARLVLHYLSKSDLKAALAELYRVLAEGSKLFVVVRSTECADAKRKTAIHDPETGLTTCTVTDGGQSYTYSRYFHTEATISEAIQTAGFLVESVETYDEQLFKDFMRTVLADHKDNVIQVVAVK